MIKRKDIEKTSRDLFVISNYQASAIADKVFGVVPQKAELVYVREVHVTKGDHGSAVTFNIERLQGTETSGNGDQLITALSLKAANATVQSGVIVTDGTQIFEAGNRVGFNLTGNSQTLAGMLIACYFRPVDDDKKRA
jgi:hypothetical protein